MQRDDEPEFPTPPEAMREEWLELPWFAVEVANMRERSVAAAIADAGIPALAPQTAVEVRAHRRYKRVELRPHPALPGYVFVGIAQPGSPARWRELLDVKGVLRVVSMEGRPSPIRATMIVNFLKTVAGNQPEPPADPDASYAPGQQVCVRGFEWHDRTVEFVARKGPQAEVLAWMFGAPRTLHVPVDRLYAA